MARRRALSLIFAVLTLTLMANQVASGLALSLFGVGLSAFVGKPFVSVSSSRPITSLDIPLLSDLPVLGPILFGHTPLVYVSLVLFAGVSVVPLPHARRASCCARSANRRSRRTRSAIR